MASMESYQALRSLDQNSSDLIEGDVVVGAVIEPGCMPSHYIIDDLKEGGCRNF